MLQKTILIVDDDRTVGETVAEALRMNDMSAVWISHGKQVMDKVREISPDLIVLDLLLPDASGINICEWIRQHPDFCSIPIILVTVLTQDSELSDSFWCSGTKANDFLTKPFDPMVLVQKIKALLSDTSETTSSEGAV